MECTKQELKDEWNENMECFQKVLRCIISNKACKGTEDVCSMFEKSGETVKPTEPAKSEEPKEETKQKHPAD